MTNDPRYSPPPPYPGRRPGDGRTAGYPAPHGHTGYQQQQPQQQQPYDWRYATQQQQQAYRQPYDPYRGAPQHPHQPAPPPKKKSRAGALTAGALAIAVVSAGIGGGVATVMRADHPAIGSTATGVAPGMPAAS